MKKTLLWILGIVFFTILTQAQTIVTVGAGTNTQRFPLGIFYGYERSAAIYRAGEIGISGELQKIAWYATLNSSAYVPMKIYLAEVTGPTMTASLWDDLIATATLVYDGNDSIIGGGWHEVLLTTPFVYTGLNHLLVLIETNYGGTGIPPLEGCAIQYSTSANRHQYWTSDNTPPIATGTVNAQRPNIKLTISAIETIDVGVSDLLSPLAIGCFGVDQLISVRIKNFGIDTIFSDVDPINLGVIINGPNPDTLYTNIFGPYIAPGDSLDVDFSDLYDMSLGGVYRFKCYAEINSDLNKINDTLAVVNRIFFIGNLPQIVDFSGFTDANLATLFPGWSESSGFPNPAGTTSTWKHTIGLGDVANTTAKIRLNGNAKRAWILSPSFVATNTSQVSFDVAVTDFGSLIDADTMGSDDAVHLMISLDCGINWMSIDSFTYNDNLLPVLATQNYSLAAYDGQLIRIGFFASEGDIDDTRDYDFHLDNINIDDFTSVKSQNDLQVSTFVLYQNQPNPVKDGTQIQFYIPKNDLVTFELRNIIGESLFFLEQYYNAGLSSINVNTDNFSNGIYFYTVTYKNKTLIKKLIVNK